ncbi:hypothetical protein CEXT_699241 [Caerostris extrusa]|uniref:LAGLIDADG homing endonuclease n=1 Tax=Caerostris extrusa TaxID=172846 RepID=A0AAV4QNS1_CAEEX|nr:hypothetical protein CEXT_699241 [Caerostris extrusa]
MTSDILQMGFIIGTVHNTRKGFLIQKKAIFTKKFQETTGDYEVYQPSDFEDLCRKLFKKKSPPERAR